MSNPAVLTWLSVSLGASVLWLVVLFISDRGVSQIWPPMRGTIWIGAAAWLLTISIYVGLIRTATADWNALDLPAWLRWSVGGVALSVAATWAQGRGIWDLGLKGTSGWDVGLVTSGAYAKRRHPQYLGQIFSLLGLALLGGSAWAMLAGIVGSVALFYASLVEDRWMASRHPDAHAIWARGTGFYL